MGQTGDSSILVIGNNAHFCYLMRRYIRKSMFRHLFSTLGDEALALAQREKPAAIVLEVERPGTSSWQILRALKGHPDTQSIPVVLCSWHDESKHGLEAGANACLRMPILYENFQNVLANTGVTEQRDKENIHEGKNWI